MRRTLPIAGVCIKMHTPKPARCANVIAQIPFLRRLPLLGACESTIRVELTTAKGPSTSSEAIFDEASLFSACLEGDSYRLALHDRGSALPQLVAISNQDTTEVTIYSGDASPGHWVSRDGVFDPILATPFLRLLLTNHLASRGGVVVHAAGAMVGRHALIFPGLSTTGKSTLMRCMQGAGLGDSILSDERIIIRRSAGHHRSGAEFRAWGTPWMSDARAVRNTSAPLAALFFLVKAKECRTVPVGPSEALRRLMPTVSYPWYHARLGQQILDTCGCLVGEIPCYELHFKPGDDVVSLLTSRAWDRDAGNGLGSCP